MATLALAYYFIAVVVVPAGINGVQVQTSKGPVEGVVVDLDALRPPPQTLFKGKAEVYKGIPFARPPIGQYRFKVGTRGICCN